MISSLFASWFSPSEAQIEALNTKVSTWCTNMQLALKKGATYSVFFGRRYSIENSVSSTLNDMTRKIEKYLKRTDALIDKIKKNNKAAHWKNGVLSAKLIVDKLSAAIEIVEGEDAKPDPELSWMQWIALKIHRFFGNLFFNKTKSIQSAKSSINITQTLLEGMAGTRIEYLREQVKDPKYVDTYFEIAQEMQKINNTFGLDF